MYSAYPPTIEKMYSLQQVLFCIHKCLFVMIFRVSLFFKKCLEIHSLQFGICSLVENIKKNSLFSRGRWAPAGLLQAANFRNKWNRRPQIGDNSLIFSFISVLLACLSYWKPILGHSLTSLLVYFQCSGHYLIPQFSFSQEYHYIQIKTQGWSFKLLVVGWLWCQQYLMFGIM